MPPKYTELREKWRIVHGVLGAGIGSGQDHSGQTDILSDAFGQFIRAGKPFFRPQALHKMHPNRFIVNIPFKIEEVSFNSQGIFPEGRIFADIGDARTNGTAIFHPHGVDPWHGEKFFRWGQIGRGKPEFASASEPMDHGSAHLVVASEQGAHLPYLASPYHIPYARGGNDRAVDDDRIQTFHGKTVTLSQGGQHLEIALPALSEGIVVADHQMFETQPRNKNIAHEILGGHGGQFSCERQNDGHLYTVGLEAFELLVERGYGWRGGMAREDISGMRIEGQGHGDHGGSGSPITNALQELGVSEVNPIEIAYGKAGADKGVVNILDAGDDDHWWLPVAIKWPLRPAWRFCSYPKSFR